MGFVEIRECYIPTALHLDGLLRRSGQVVAESHALDQFDGFEHAPVFSGGVFFDQRDVFLGQRVLENQFRNIVFGIVDRGCLVLVIDKLQEGCSRNGFSFDDSARGGVGLATLCRSSKGSRWLEKEFLAVVPFFLNKKL